MWGARPSSPAGSAGNLPLPGTGLAPHSPVSRWSKGQHLGTSTCPDPHSPAGSVASIKGQPPGCAMSMGRWVHGTEPCLHLPTPLPVLAHTPACSCLHPCPPLLTPAHTIACTFPQPCLYLPTYLSIPAHPCSHLPIPLPVPARTIACTCPQPCPLRLHLPTPACTCPPPVPADPYLHLPTLVCTFSYPHL